MGMEEWGGEWEVWGGYGVGKRANQGQEGCVCIIGGSVAKML